MSTYFSNVVLSHFMYKVMTYLLSRKLLHWNHSCWKGMKMRNVIFSTTDFELFDQDITRQDYEFFQKHKGAFKCLLEDQTEQQKQKFVNTFKDFSVNHGCVKDFPIKSDNLFTYVEDVMRYLTEHFVHGKVSKAKCLVMDAVCLAQNRSLLHHVGSPSYAKDPFCHKDTRDVFRRLFGDPKEQDACLKAMFTLSLYVKFGGSVCRYLRRWLEAEKLDELGVTSSTTALLKSKLKSTKTESEQTTTAVSQSEDKPASSESTSSSSRMVAVATVGELLGGKASSSDGDDYDDEEDNLDAKVIRRMQSVLRPPSIEYMEVYKGSKDVSYRRLREDFHLDKPHPNQEFEERCRKKDEERIEASLLHEVIFKDCVESPIHGFKRRQCANCKKVEKARGVYKKCERCKGKGTKFYCSRQCQGEDWVSRHRRDHSSVEQPS